MTMNRRPYTRRVGRRSERAFTLIEVLVAAAILAVLAGVAVPVATGISRKAKVAATKSEMASLAKALRAHGTDVGFDPKKVAWGRFPAEVKGKRAYATILGADLDEDAAGIGWDPVARSGWNGPYMSSDLVSADADGDGKDETIRSYQADAWGRYYVYTNRDGNGKPVKTGAPLRVVRLLSGGPDLDPATAADNIELSVYKGKIY